MSVELALFLNNFEDTVQGCSGLRFLKWFIDVVGGDRKVL